MYSIRNANEKDFNFIHASLKSADCNLERDYLFNVIIKTCDVYILTPETDSTLIVGTIAVCDDKLAWLYVKEIYRRMGIATYMLNMCNAKHEFFIKGKSEAWKHLAKHRKLKWNPYLILPTLSSISQ